MPTARRAAPRTPARFCRAGSPTHGIGRLSTHWQKPRGGEGRARVPLGQPTRHARPRRRPHWDSTPDKRGPR